jgi:hypothetical protein
MEKQQKAFLNSLEKLILQGEEKSLKYFIRNSFQESFEDSNDSSSRKCKGERVSNGHRHGVEDQSNGKHFLIR